MGLYGAPGLVANLVRPCFQLGSFCRDLMLFISLATHAIDSCMCCISDSCAGEGFDDLNHLP
jgi:hypothetical protein